MSNFGFIKMIKLIFWYFEYYQKMVREYKKTKVQELVPFWENYLFSHYKIQHLDHYTMSVSSSKLVSKWVLELIMIVQLLIRFCTNEKQNFRCTLFTYDSILRSKNACKSVLLIWWCVSHHTSSNWFNILIVF